MRFELPPSYSEPEDLVIYSAKKVPGVNSSTDIFSVKRQNGYWGKPEPLNILNSEFTDESPYISEDGATIIFASDRDGSSEFQDPEKPATIKVSFDLYWSRKTNGVWLRPVKVPGTINTTFHEKAPAIAADGTIYFSRSNFGDISTSKIYKATLVSGKYDKVEPLPEIINMNFFELAFRPGLDDRSFYFSSRRPGGYGSWDIYRVQLNKAGYFMMPENLGELINTPQSDMFCSRMKDRVLIASSADTGFEYRLYSIASDKFILPAKIP